MVNKPHAIFLGIGQPQTFGFCHLVWPYITYTYIVVSHFKLTTGSYNKIICQMIPNLLSIVLVKAAHKALPLHQVLIAFCFSTESGFISTHPWSAPVEFPSNFLAPVFLTNNRNHSRQQLYH